MSKFDLIKDAVLLQKRELEGFSKQDYIQREIKDDLHDNLIRVITGPRRAGKSFFAMHLLSKLEHFGYVNFDDEMLISVQDYNEIICAVNMVYDNPKYLLLDEVQNLNRWELFVNRLQRQGYRLLITGSNSNLLSREFSTHLTGRHLLITVLPFSFREFANGNHTTAEFKEMLAKYIRTGGYPEPFVKGLDYGQYLKTLVDSVLYKDIAKRYNLRHISAIEALFNYLVSNIAQEFSYGALAKMIGCLSQHTVEKYLNYLEETFLFFRLNRFSFKVKEQILSNKKIYSIDNGLVTSTSFMLSPDMGKLYENAVAVELKRTGKEVYFWKGNNYEVDFVVKKGQRVTELIQVCYDLDKARKREIRALLTASRELKCSNLLVINGGYEGEETSEWFGIKGRIRFVPLWKWLLIPIERSH